MNQKNLLRPIALVLTLLWCALVGASSRYKEPCPLEQADETVDPMCGAESERVSTLDNVINRFYQSKFTLRAINCCANDDYTSVAGIQIFHHDVATGQMQAAPCVGNCSLKTCEFILTDMFGQLASMHTTSVKLLGLNNFSLAKFELQTENGYLIKACSRIKVSPEHEKITQSYSFKDNGPIIAVSAQMIGSTGNICGLTPITDTCPYHPDLAHIPSIDADYSFRLPDSGNSGIQQIQTTAIDMFSFDLVSSFYEGGSHIEPAPQLRAVDVNILSAPSKPDEVDFIHVSPDFTEFTIAPIDGSTKTFQYEVQLVGVFDEFSLPTNSFFVDVCQIEIDLSEDFKDNFQTVKKSVGEKIKVNPKGKLVGNSNKKIKIEKALKMGPKDFVVAQDCQSKVSVTTNLDVAAASLPETEVLLNQNTTDGEVIGGLNDTQESLNDTQESLNDTQESLNDTRESLNDTQESLNDDTQESLNDTQEQDWFQWDYYHSHNRRLQESGGFNVDLASDENFYLAQDQDVALGNYQVVQTFTVMINGVREPSLEPESLVLLSIEVVEEEEESIEDQGEGVGYNEIVIPLSCRNTEIVPSVVHSMVVELGSGPVNQTISPFDDTYSLEQGEFGACGELKYELVSFAEADSGPTADDFLSLNNTVLTLVSDNQDHLGTYEVGLLVSFAERPDMNTTIPFYVSVKKDVVNRMADINELPIFAQNLVEMLKLPVLKEVTLQLPEIYDLEQQPVKIRVEYGNMALKACDCAKFDEETRTFTFRLSKDFEKTLSMVQIFLGDEYGETYYYFYLEGLPQERTVVPVEEELKKVTALPPLLDDDFDLQDWLGRQEKKEEAPPAELEIPIEINVGRMDREGNIKIKFSEELEPMSQTRLNYLKEKNLIQLRLMGQHNQYAQMKSFNWTIYQPDDRRDLLIVKITFDNPDQISAYNVDRLAVFFLNADQYFSSKSGKVISPFYQVKKGLRPQMDFSSKEAQILDSGSKVAELVLKTLIIQNLVHAFIFKTSLQTLWGAINALQIVAFLPLYNVHFPAQSYFLFDMLVQVVSFDFAQPTELWEFNITETDAINEKAEWLGFESQNIFDDLGSVNFILAFLIINSICLPLLLVMARKLNILKQVQKYLGSEKSVSQAWLRFLLETYLELLICIIVSSGFFKLVDESNVSGWDFFSMIEYVILTLVVSLFMVFVAWFSFYKMRWLVNMNYRDLKIKHSELMLTLYGVDHINRMTLQRTGKFREIQSNLQDVLNRQNQELGSSASEIEDSNGEDKFHDIFKREVTLRASDKANEQRMLEVYGNVKKKILKDIVGQKLSPEEIARELEIVERYEWCSPLYDGLKLYSKSAQWYNFIFLVRRALFCFTAFFLFDYPVFQILLYMLGSLFELTYLIWCRPFESRFQNFLEVFNEIIVLLVAYHMMMLLICDGKTIRLMQLIGISLVVHVTILSTVNVVFNLGDQFKGLYQKARVAYYRRKFRKIAAKQKKAEKEAKVHPVDPLALPSLPSPLHTRVNSVNSNRLLMGSARSAIEEDSDESDFSASSIFPKKLVSVETQTAHGLSHLAPLPRLLIPEVDLPHSTTMLHLSDIDLQKAEGAPSVQADIEKQSSNQTHDISVALTGLNFSLSRVEDEPQCSPSMHTFIAPFTNSNERLQEKDKSKECVEVARRPAPLIVDDDVKPQNFADDIFGNFMGKDLSFKEKVQQEPSTQSVEHFKVLETVEQEPEPRAAPDFKAIAAKSIKKRKTQIVQYLPRQEEIGIEPSSGPSLDYTLETVNAKGSVRLTTDGLSSLRDVDYIRQSSIGSGIRKGSIDSQNTSKLQTSNCSSSNKDEQSSNSSSDKGGDEKSCEKDAKKYELPLDEGEDNMPPPKLIGLDFINIDELPDPQDCTPKERIDLTVAFTQNALKADKGKRGFQRKQSEPLNELQVTQLEFF